MKISFLNFCLVFLSVILSKNLNAETILTINGKPVSVEEFEYIYKKNNINDQADFSKKSLEDYLQLFINYKLKVQQAKDLGLDTINSLNSEYDGYKRQLLETHIQRQILEPLITQEFERSKEDREIAHVFISLKTENALAKINEAYKKLKAGAEFSKVAKEYSEDEMSANNGGIVGYFTVMQVGIPEIEDAIYQTSLNNFSEVIKTEIGYHIIRVTDIRPARGKLKVAIIKMTIPSQDDEKLIVKTTMDDIYQSLLKGQNFGELVLKYSDDINSKENSGELDWFGINTYVREFEEAAFALQKDGDFSKPFSTATAYYIVKKVMDNRNPTFKEAESVLKMKILKSKLFNDKMKAFDEDVIQKNNFKMMDDNVEKYKEKLVSTIDKYPFTYTPSEKALPILSIDGKVYNENDISEIIKNKYSKVTGKLGVERVDALYNTAINELVLESYEKDLINSSYDYSSLLDEYKNGVLIFELTKNKVWNKATTDSIGLKNFYNKMGSQYMWNSRAEILKINSEESISNSALTKMIKKNKLNSKIAWDKYLQANPKVKFNITAETIEQNVSPESDQIKWQVGLHSDNDKDFYQVVKISPKQRKDLAEVRGFVVAAYQEHLEKEWLKQLHKNYTVDINQAVLDSLVK
ncbi:MAG TPA: peptidylprolyl isomerase [Chitinophagales bacterium]|nr:peptidylprolyl isomerase [Chitinophagales bacterium]